MLELIRLILDRPTLAIVTMIAWSVVSALALGLVVLKFHRAAVVVGVLLLLVFLTLSASLFAECDLICSREVILYFLGIPLFLVTSFVLPLAWIRTRLPSASVRLVLRRSLVPGIIVLAVSIGILILSSLDLVADSWTEWRQIRAFRTRYSFHPPTYLPLQIQRFSRLERGDENSLMWTYGCLGEREVDDPSSSMRIRFVAVEDTSEGLSEIERAYRDRGPHTEVEVVEIDGLASVYKKYRSGLVSFTSLAYEAHGLFVGIHADGSCSLSKTELIEIGKSMN